MNYNQRTVSLGKTDKTEISPSSLLPPSNKTKPLCALNKQGVKHYTDCTFDMYLESTDIDITEIHGFNAWREACLEDGTYGFEAARLHAQDTEVTVQRESGETLCMLNFSSYNYLGYTAHSQVIKAAKHALDQFGLGAGNSPILSGTLAIHKELENNLSEFLGVEGYSISLFSSGYGANVGTLSAYMKTNHVLVLDTHVHASIMEGVRLSGSEICYFKHNNPQHLEKVLKRVAQTNSRILVCIESVYSTEGEIACIAEVVTTAKKYGAKVFVDEAHSTLLTGPHGRGLCAEQGVLDQIDLLVMTFSKAFGGVGGALYAPQKVIHYVNWYAACRMFSCALDPAVTGGVIASLALAKGSDGELKRARLKENAQHMRSLLATRLDIGKSESWIIPVFYGTEKKSYPLHDYLQRVGLDTGLMQYPAVPRGRARLRLFITSEHTSEQLEKAAAILFEAAERFDFLNPR
ncbi:MAG: aminotransferase class I/II-fold pyridoxal phosphate-dependent enzyme [Kiritimatiellae bacterium]|nr:aminotransferase class I/II-fold pyridoxal phosphate-dependent enzyme [Kiritimatiellia bacterium]